ncbi:MAG TPA: hypothetical protein VIG44_14060, partial [Thermomicrobiales bacterium]
QRTLDYAATKVQVLVSDSRQAIASTTLHNDGPIQAPQGATPFKQFSLDNPQAGQQIDLTIGPSPSTPAQATTPTAQKSTFARIRDKATVPFLLLLAGFCLVLMLLILRAPQRGTTEAPAPRRAAGDPLPTPDETQADTSLTEQPGAAPDAVETNVSRSQQRRRVRGRPHDYDLDDAEREIEAANSDTGEARNHRDQS